MVNLGASPFFLDADSIRWVEETYASMSVHEKACQLFTNPLQGKDREELIAFLEKYPINGMSFRGSYNDTVFCNTWDCRL